MVMIVWVAGIEFEKKKLSKEILVWNAKFLSQTSLWHTKNYSA